MPKASKSSASAGTRKKHAKKAAKGEPGDGEDDAGPSQQQRGKQRGEKKLSKAQKRALPKIKQYIPPPKPPAPPIPDPLDGQGLARTLPAELVVTLRRLGKKDDVTRRKGLEELREEWVGPLLAAPGSGEDEAVEREMKETALLDAVPVWLHNLSSLLVSPFHRSLSIQLHSDLLSIPSIRASIINYLSLGLLPGTQNRDVLGSWLVAVLEEGRRAGGAMRAWEDCTTWSVPAVAGSEADEGSSSTSHINLRDQVTSIIEYFSLSILDPPSLHDDIHPLPVSSTPAPTPPKVAKGVKSKPPLLASAPQPPVEDQSVLDERIARYRVGGLTGLAWLVSQLSRSGYPSPPAPLLALLGNRALWSSLSSLHDEEDEAPGFGYAQPTVRRAAYALLDALIEAYSDTIAEKEILEMLSVEVLGCCWKETEATVWTAGVSVVKFLSKYRQAWEIALRAQEGEASPHRSPRQADADGDEEMSDEEDHELQDNGTDADEHHDTVLAGAVDSQAFTDFLEWTATICPTIPHLTYPLLLVIISSLPDSILPLSRDPSPALQALFAHLWSPVDARLLATHAVPGQLSAFQAFYKDAVDCTVFLTSKALRSPLGEGTAGWLVRTQMGERAWKEGVMIMGGRKKRRGELAVETEAEVFGAAVARLALISPELTGELVAYVEKTVLEMCFPMNQDGGGAKEAYEYLARSLGVIHALRATNTDDMVVKRLGGIVEGLGEECVKRLRAAIENDRAQSVLYAGVIGRILAEESTPELGEALSSLILESPDKFYDTLLAPSVISLLSHLVNTPSSSAIIDSLWAYISSPAHPQPGRFSLACDALHHAHPPILAPKCLDAIALEAAESAANHHSSAGGSSIVRASLTLGAPSLSPEGSLKVSELINTYIVRSVNDLVSGKSAYLPCLDMLEIINSAPTELLSTSTLQAMYRLVHIVPRLPGKENMQDEGQAKLMLSLPVDRRNALAEEAVRDVAALIGSINCVARPRDLVDVALLSSASQAASSYTSTLASTLFSESSVSGWIRQFSSITPDPSLVVLDQLVPFTSEDSAPQSEEYDTRGLSSAARSAEGCLALVRSDRSIVTSRPELLRFALHAAVLAQDGLDIPGGSRGLFREFTAKSDLSELIREADGALSYALADLSEAPASWHTSAIAQIKAGKAEPDADFLQSILVSLANDIRETDPDIASRVFRDSLARHFRQSGAGEKEAGEWLAFAMSIAERTPSLALPLILAIKPLLLDSPPFATAQNRLASSLSSIPSSSASGKGIPALRLLLASAPPEDAASVFLPQQRAIFVLRHVQKWLTADDTDLGEEIEFYLAQLYLALAPIVQDVPGDHWDNIFDLVTAGLEAGSLGEPTTFAMLYQTLLLLREIRDLCGSNKALRASWTAKDAHLGLVLRLFLECRDAESAPVQRIQELLLDLIGDIPEKALSQASLPALSDLLRLSSSSPIQCTAYRILSRVVRANTVALVFEVEASVSEAQDGHASRTIALPSSLVEIVGAGAGVDWHVEEPIHLVLGQLLAWMGILDHFDDASRTLRWAYLDQLSSSQLIQTSLIPLLFGILGVSEVGAWNFPAGQYAVDEFYPDLLDPNDLPDLAPLASHLFYRSLVTLPSVMRTYYESLKDRQLSMSMLSFVARWYSPVIISHEFSALREPSALSTLTEEGLNVKIAQGGGATVAAGTGSAEAIASYVVDEQPMEIGIRLPAEFPLKGVEIRDLRRVGVPENKWRGWLMSVQQTITSRNGLILEALTVFKKNVSLHFEGVVECAICYSIISLTDRTLPTKPCRTCKNRFHASCLFKWFNSSHSSSCPMCRSLF